MQFCTKVVHVTSSHATRLTWGCKMTFSSTRSWCGNPCPIFKKKNILLILTSVIINNKDLLKTRLILNFYAHISCNNDWNNFLLLNTNAPLNSVYNRESEGHVIESYQVLQTSFISIYKRQIYTFIEACGVNITVLANTVVIVTWTNWHNIKCC